jgi:hypothetical protein
MNSIRVVKFHLIFSFFFLLSGYVFPQKENNNWFFGSGAGVNFDTGIGIGIPGGLPGSHNTSTCVSDSVGIFLCGSNGWKTYDRNFSLMLNGSDLYGDANSTQSAFFIKKPLEDSVYYLFTVRRQYASPPYVTALLI